MTAEEAMDRIGNILESVYAGNTPVGDALNEIARVRGAYLMGES